METTAFHRASSTDASAGAIPEMCTNAAVVLLCAALLTLALTTALLLTLPSALDAVAGSAPSITAEAPQTDERQPGQAIADWVDALSDSELAAWHLRWSD